MRAPMASASWIMEGTIDAIARELSIDPVAVRRLNSIVEEDLPFVTITGETYVDVTPRRRLRQRSRPSITRPPVRGRPGARSGPSCRTRIVHRDGVNDLWLRILQEGRYSRFRSRSRCYPHGADRCCAGVVRAVASGQGYETTLAQCTAEGLGARLEDIRVDLGHRILLHTEWVAAARGEEPQGEGSCCSPRGGSRQRSSQSPPT